MEDALKQRVVGQDHVVTAVSDAVRISRAGLQAPNRPVASFLFLGPTGVGKVCSSHLKCKMSRSLCYCRPNFARPWRVSCTMTSNVDCEYRVSHFYLLLLIQHSININMSEYHDRHTISRLIGAAPGYVGFEEGGQLTEAVRRRPYGTSNLFSRYDTIT